MQEHAGYRKIKIQQLQPRKPIEPSPVTQKDLIRVLEQKSKYSNLPTLCYMDTGISDQRILSRKIKQFKPSSFFDAFFYAYRTHGDIVLIPDDIWIMICFYVSRYVDQHGEKLRSRIVKHEGVKKLEVVECADSEHQSLLMEKNWNTFFSQITKKIQNQTLAQASKAFTCNFSTTTPTHKLLSSCLLLNSFKKFFTYHRSIGISCGINNIYMAGVLEDWTSLITKLENMVMYDVDGKLKQYVEHVKKILVKFRESFQGRVDVDWWNCVVKDVKMRGACGEPRSMEVDGWIMHFYGIYQKRSLLSFPDLVFQVPITLENKWTGNLKELKLVSDWVSVSKLSDSAYKPDAGMCIFEISSKQISTSKKEQPNTNKLQEKL